MWSILFDDLLLTFVLFFSLSFIFSPLGVSLRPMCIALELAPMGSLFGILDKKLEAIKAAQADLPTANIKMPGGVLGHEISARIALQVRERKRASLFVQCSLCIYENVAQSICVIHFN